MKQSPLLTQFYREIQAWIDDGARFDRPLFYSRAGLCKNLELWYHRRFEASAPEEYEQLRDELFEQFVGAGLDLVFPFDGGSYDNYNADRDAIYQSPKRLAWIKEHAK